MSFLIFKRTQIISRQIKFNFIIKLFLSSVKFSNGTRSSILIDSFCMLHGINLHRNILVSTINLDIYFHLKLNHKLKKNFF